MNLLDEIAAWLDVKPTSEPAKIKVGEYDLAEIRDQLKVKFAEFQENKVEAEQEEQPVDPNKLPPPAEPHERFLYFHTQLAFESDLRPGDIDMEAFKLAVAPMIEFVDYVISFYPDLTELHSRALKVRG